MHLTLRRVYLSLSIICLGYSVTIHSQNYFPDTLLYDSISTIVITGELIPIQKKNSIHLVETIDKKLIKKTGATQLDEVLLSLSTIDISNDLILGKTAQIRGGSTRNIAILIDGIPVIGRLGGGIDLSQISLQNIERIEIVKGPLSNLYGNNASGGVINIITQKEDSDNGFSSQINAQLESIGYQKYNAALNYKVNNLRFSVFGTHNIYQPQIRDSLRVRETVALNDSVSYKRKKYPFLPKTMSIIGGAMKLQTSMNIDIDLKYQKYTDILNSYGAIKRPIYKPYAFDESYQTNRDDVTLKLSYAPSKAKHYELTQALNWYSRITEKSRIDFDNDSLYLVEEPLTDSYFSSFSIFDSHLKFSSFYSMRNGLNIVYDEIMGDKIAVDTTEDNIKLSSTSIFHVSNFHITNRIDIMSSLRFVYRNQDQNAITPHIAVKYRFFDEMSLRLNYAQGYRLPSAKELYFNFIDINHYIVGNERLNPEKSKEFQSSLDYKIDDHNHLTANFYTNKIQDRISLVAFEDLKFTYENQSSYQSWGGSLNYTFNTSNFSISADASYVSWESLLDDLTYNGDIYNMVIKTNYLIPRIDVNIFMQYRYEANPPIIRDYDGERTIEESSSENYLNTSISKSFWKQQITLTAGINNLLDIKRVKSQNSVSGSAHQESTNERLVSEGRNYFCSLALNF